MGQIANPTPKTVASPSYTQTFSETTRTQAASALATNISISLLTEVAGKINTTNEAVNELKKLLNGVIDDLQTANVLG